MSNQGPQDTAPQTIASEPSQQRDTAVDHTLARIVPWTPINWPRGTVRVAERSESSASISGSEGLTGAVNQENAGTAHDISIGWKHVSRTGPGATTLDIIHLSAVPFTPSAADSNICAPPVDTVSAEQNDVSLALGKCVTCLKHKLECNRHKPQCSSCYTYKYKCKYTQRFGSRKDVYLQDRCSVKLRKLLPAPLGP